jgi:hypothetical protein
MKARRLIYMDLAERTNFDGQRCVTRPLLGVDTCARVTFTILLLRARLRSPAALLRDDQYLK